MTPSDRYVAVWLSHWHRMRELDAALDLWRRVLKAHLIAMLCWASLIIFDQLRGAI